VSLTGPDFISADSPVLVTAAGQDCFHCGQPVEDPSVLWSGATREVFLHPGCAADLLLRLGRDILEWQHRTGRRFGSPAGLV
jgi:hypothetical protein